MPDFLSISGFRPHTSSIPKQPVMKTSQKHCAIKVAQSSLSVLLSEAADPLACPDTVLERSDTFRTHMIFITHSGHNIASVTPC